MLEHEYSVLGGKNRVHIGHCLGIFASVVSAVVVFLVLSAVDIAKAWGLSPNLPPSVLSLLGAGTVFLVLSAILSKYAWKWPGIASYLSVPNLAGEWNCVGQTINPQGEVVYDWTGSVTIVQNWDRLRVRVKTAQSMSQSTTAALICDEADGYRLFYTYRNDPAIGEPELRSHRGSAEITFAKDLRSGAGEYFNGHGRYTFGRMTLTRS